MISQIVVHVFVCYLMCKKYKLEDNLNHDTTLYHITLIATYHDLILNGIEKYFLRLIFQTISPFANQIVIARSDYFLPHLVFGFPSGHAEVSTIICVLLTKLKYISIFGACVIIFVVSCQRLVFQKQNLVQVVVGVLFGLIY